jgi:hypothetical protein
MQVDILIYEGSRSLKKISLDMSFEDAVWSHVSVCTQNDEYRAPWVACINSVRQNLDGIDPEIRQMALDSGYVEYTVLKEQG